MKYLSNNKEEKIMKEKISVAKCTASLRFTHRFLKSERIGKTIKLNIRTKKNKS
jgi:hypothetical protein